MTVRNLALNGSDGSYNSLEEVVMDRRKLGAALGVLACSMFMLAGTASARTVTPQTAESAGGACSIKSLPSFIAQGEFSNSATVADVIEISCDPYVYSSGEPVTITASQLYSRCHDDISWYDANDEGEYYTDTGRSFTVHLDVDGNANVALIAGPKCMVGADNLISVDEDSSPYETFTTSFEVAPDKTTPAGLTMMPSSQVEDAESSGVVTIASAEFTKASETDIRLGYLQLADRCERGDHTVLVRADRDEIPADEIEGLYGETEDAIELDNDGNGFAILVGSDSCQEGTSLIEADEESSPFGTEEAYFTVEAPAVRYKAAA